MDPIHVRHAIEADLEVLTELGMGIQELHHQGRPDLFREADPHALAEFLAARLTDSILLVADRDNDAVGYLLAEHRIRDASPFFLESNLLYIHHIAVRADYQGSGAGSALMEAAAGIARDQGATSLRLDSWSFNSDAHEFFTARGFQRLNVVFESRL